jgi:hypothetical protein
VGLKLLLAVPTYGPVDSQANRHLRRAMMQASKDGGVEWVGDLSPERMKFDAARNVVVTGALEMGDRADAILWVDSDVVLPPGAVSMLVAQQKDFITGIYVQREKPHWPLVANYDPAADTFMWLAEWPADVVAPIDGCGFGCVLTSTRMLRAMTPPWFTFEKFSEDFDFCRRAAAAGFQLFVHTGVVCGHLKDPEPATVEDFFALRDAGGLREYVTRPVDSAA